MWRDPPAAEQRADDADDDAARFGRIDSAIASDEIRRTLNDTLSPSGMLVEDVLITWIAFEDRCVAQRLAERAFVRSRWEYETAEQAVAMEHLRIAEAEQRRKQRERERQLEEDAPGPGAGPALPSGSPLTPPDGPLPTPPSGPPPQGAPTPIVAGTVVSAPPGRGGLVQGRVVVAPPPPPSPPGGALPQQREEGRSS